MICYLCGTGIPEDHPFYNDYDRFVCKPCFLDARRCWVCRFPGKAMEDVEGLGPECEFCRERLIREGDDLAEILVPAAPFLQTYGLEPPARNHYQFVDRTTLRQMQTKADVADEEFIDDFLLNAYPVFYRDGRHHCLRRMTRSTVIAYGIVQLAAAAVCGKTGLKGLEGDTPLHHFARGYCHFIGFDAAARLKYDLEWRQMRKWPANRLQGDFHQWQAMARFRSPSYMAEYFRSHISVLMRKHTGKATPTLQKEGTP